MEKKGRTTKGFVLTCIWGGQKVVPPKVLIEIVFGYPKTCFGRSYIYIYISMRLFPCGAQHDARGQRALPFAFGLFCQGPRIHSGKWSYFFLGSFFRTPKRSISLACSRVL